LSFFLTQRRRDAEVAFRVHRAQASSADGFSFLIPDWTREAPGGASVGLPRRWPRRRFCKHRIPSAFDHARYGGTSRTAEQEPDVRLAMDGPRRPALLCCSADRVVKNTCPLVVIGIFFRVFVPPREKMCYTLGCLTTSIRSLAREITVNQLEQLREAFCDVLNIQPSGDPRCT
jgi:hypothetical protein